MFWRKNPQRSLARSWPWRGTRASDNLTSIWSITEIRRWFHSPVPAHNTPYPLFSACFHSLDRAYRHKVKVEKNLLWPLVCDKGKMANKKDFYFMSWNNSWRSTIPSPCCSHHSHFHQYVWPWSERNRGWHLQPFINYHHSPTMAFRITVGR